MSISDLARFREDDGPVEVPGPEPLDLAFQGTLLAFDQTLSATGWAALRCSGMSLYVVSCGTVKTKPTGIKGYGDYMERSADLFDLVRSVVTSIHPDRIVHEEPPMGSGLSKPESSLVAGAVVRTVARAGRYPLGMVHAKRAKKRLTGNGNADKKEVRAAVLDIVTPPGRINEHIIDALALGLVDLERA